MKHQRLGRLPFYIAMIGFAAASIWLAGCGKAWVTDYGTPAAQFESKDVLAKGKPFVGKKITVKGTVARMDASKPGAAAIYLTDGIACNFGKMEAMAKSVASGQTVYIDGILAKCEAGSIVIDPAILRDPSAPFSP